MSKPLIVSSFLHWIEVQPIWQKIIVSCTFWASSADLLKFFLQRQNWFILSLNITHPQLTVRSLLLNFSLSCSPLFPRAFLSLPPCKCLRCRRKNATSVKTFLKGDQSKRNRVYPGTEWECEDISIIAWEILDTVICPLFHSDVWFLITILSSKRMRMDWQ